MRRPAPAEREQGMAGTRVLLLSSWPEMSGWEPWAHPCEDVCSASSGLLGRASPRQLHPLLGRHFAGLKGRGCQGG